MERKLLVVIASRYFVNAEGVWTTTSYHYQMWSECLDDWDHVTVAALAVNHEPTKNAMRVDGPCVSFAPIINSKGIAGAAFALPVRFIQLRKLVLAHDALVLHVPSELGTMAFYWAQQFNKPCGLDVRGDQSVNDSFLKSRGIPGSKVLAAVNRKAFGWVRSGAKAAIFVSKDLKERYPIPDERAMSVVSDLRLPDWWFTSRNKLLGRGKIFPFHIISVGRLEAAKGFSTLIDAFALLVKRLDNLMILEIVGSGPLESKLRFQAKALGIDNLVEFRGYIPWGPQLQFRLCAADLFVLPSITEGMPRVVLEAMACGLPVVSTNTGGVKEILSEEDMVPTRDIEALSCKLQEVICDPLRLEAMSRRNFAKVQHFRLDALRSSKQSFYKRLAGNI